MLFIYFLTPLPEKFPLVFASDCSLFHSLITENIQRNYFSFEETEICLLREWNKKNDLLKSYLI